MTLPGWLDPLPDAEQQRALDRWAIDERAIPSLELMERAGSGLAELAAELAPTGAVAVVCGRGNNGGDGLVAARLLRTLGRDVGVFLAGDADDLQGDARVQLERLPGEPPEPLPQRLPESCTAVIDALLGTGTSGPPREEIAAAIDVIARARAAGARVIACDVPSGIDGSTGEAPGAAVRADATATFHAAKPGLWINPGKASSGGLRVIDIGIPGDAPLDAGIGLIGPEVLATLPRREAASTKFSAGSVLVCGGSRGLTGAPSLAAESAMRAGAGYVTVAVPRSLELVFELRLVEAMSVALADDDGALAPAAVEAALERAARVDALVLGPGIGRSDGAQAFARELAARAELPLVLDADGLNAHAGRLASLAARAAPTILTPHAGELGRLLERASGVIEQHRLAAVREAAAAAGAVVVLKGDDTLVADPDGRVAVSRGGAPALATAGTGDVLAGLAGALLARGLDPFRAACAAVFAHAEAGRIAAAPHGPDGVIARDVIAALPAALA